MGLCEKAMTRNTHAFAPSRLFEMILVAGALATASCGSDRESVYPVKGQVLLDGRPAENASVVLHPQGGSEQLERLRPHGRTDSEGCFQLTTYVAGDGAPAGEYKVTVTCPGPAPEMDPDHPDPEMAIMGPDRLNGRYRDAGVSPLRVTVVKGTNNLKPFDLK